MPQTVHSLQEFKELIDRLSVRVEEIREARIEEYRAAGTKPPERVPYEEIDLGDIADDLLSVQKTLQWRGHNRLLGTVYFDKGRRLAFAGICQFVKDRYNGAFWDAYEREIGWRADQTVYNTIWARAFRLEGVELILRSNGRQFVDSFINETGIPAHIQDDLLEFFRLFWTYFREGSPCVEDIVELIDDVAKAEAEDAHLSFGDRQSLRAVCREVKDMASSFARRVAKLLAIALFIENSDEIIPDGRQENLEKIQVGTGIDPTSIFRNSGRLEQFWSYILERVIPARLERVARHRFGGRIVQKPDGTSVKTENLRCDMYGVYTIGPSRFVCVPDISLDLEFLENLDEDVPMELACGLLLRSRERLTLQPEAEDEDELFFSTSLPLYRNGTELGHFSLLKSRGSTHSVRVRAANGEERDQLKLSPRRYFNPRLRVRWNWRRRRYSLYAALGTISLNFRGFPYSQCQLRASSRTKSLAEVELDERGGYRTSIRDLIFTDPRPGPIDFQAHLDGREGRPIGSLEIDEVMLFWRRGGRRIPSGTVDRSSNVATSGFVVFLSSDIPVDTLSLENLIEESCGQTICGAFRVVPLRWKDTGSPCSVSVVHSDEDLTWRFERCLDFDLELRCVDWNGPLGIRVPGFVGTIPEEFELRITPSPSAAEAEFLHLEAVDMKAGSVYRRLTDCGLESISDEEAVVSGAHFGDLIRALDNLCEGPAEISVRLRTDSARSEARRLLLLPNLSVDYGRLEAGARPTASLSIGGEEADASCQLLADDGSDRLGEVAVFVENDGQAVGVETKTFTGEFIIPDLHLRVGVSAQLCPVGCFLWKKEEKQHYELEDLSLADISEWELLTIDPVPGGSIEVIPPLSLESSDDVSGMCRRHRIVETDAVLQKSIEAEIRIGGVRFSFFINNDVRIEDVTFRPHTRGGCLVGRQLLSGGRAYGVHYCVSNEDGIEVLRTEPFRCDPHAKEPSPLEIPLPNQLLWGRSCGQVTVRGFIRKPYGVEPVDGMVFKVSLEDRVIDDDWGWVRRWIETRRVEDAEKNWRYLLELINRSPVSGPEWDKLKREVTQRFLRAATKRLTGRCKKVLRKEFRINV